MSREERGVGRLGFLKGLAAGTALPLAGGCAHGCEAVRRPVVSLAHETCRVISPLVREPVSFVLVGDTHLTVNDGRGDAFLEFTARMGGRRRESASEAESFRKTLAAAKAAKADLVALVGDQLSFPSWAGVEFLRRELDAAGVPWLYTSGNHDWHFEGMPGTEKDLRARYVKEILAPMYPDVADPLCFTRVVKGVRFVAIDDSAYLIRREQVEFWKAEAAKGDPVALVMHVPMYVPGWGVFTCGCPDWGAAKDPYWEIERREKWRAEGPTPESFEFREAVLSTPNLVGVFTGHFHVPMNAHIRGQNLFSVVSNRGGGFLDVAIG